MLRKKKTNILDQDTSFALSLVPLLKALPVQKKIDVQIMVLKIFQTLRFSPQYSFPLRLPLQTTVVPPTSKDAKFNLSPKFRPSGILGQQDLTSSERTPVQENNSI